MLFTFCWFSITRFFSLQEVLIGVISRHHIVLEVNDDLMRVIVSTVILTLLLLFAILWGLSRLLLSLSIAVDFIFKIVFKLQVMFLVMVVLLIKGSIKLTSFQELDLNVIVLKDVVVTQEVGYSLIVK